jgi:hypothetical protein
MAHKGSKELHVCTHSTVIINAIDIPTLARVYFLLLVVWLHHLEFQQADETAFQFPIDPGESSANHGEQQLLKMHARPHVILLAA